MLGAVYVNGVQFLLWVHKQCTYIVLVRRYVANTKKIVNRVSRSLLVACRVAKGCIVNGPLGRTVFFKLLLVIMFAEL